MAETKKKSKKWIPVLAVIVIIGVVAVVVLRNRTGGGVNADAVAEEPTIAPDSDSNILIAYFTQAENTDVDARSSASVTAVDGVAKGNIRAIADEIAAETGGDLFSIRTERQYPSKWSELLEQAKAEQDEKKMPKLKTHIENLDQYDTIYIGYCTWWYDMPLALYSLFHETDFSGKQIYVFNSANGSGLLDTIQKIEKVEPDAKVDENGLSIHQDDIKNVKEEVKNWLSKLGK